VSSAKSKDPLLCTFLGINKDPPESALAEPTTLSESLTPGGRHTNAINFYCAQKEIVFDRGFLNQG